MFNAEITNGSHTCLTWTTVRWFAIRCFAVHKNMCLVPIRWEIANRKQGANFCVKESWTIFGWGREAIDVVRLLYGRCFVGVPARAYHAFVVDDNATSF